MRTRVLLVAAALAVAGILAAMAFNVATINTSASAATVSTDSALLALSCKDASEAGNKDEACSVGDNGVLNLNFEKGLGDGLGFQPNSEYEFHELVTITNNSKENLAVQITSEGPLFSTPGLTVTMDPDLSLPIDLPSDGFIKVTFKFELADGVQLITPDDLTADIKVTATAQ